MDTSQNSYPSLTVDCNFPGGNIIVDEIDENTVYLHQDLRDTEAFWFYWHFRVRGAGARTLVFVFTLGDVIGTRGPAFSSDGGITWAWLGGESVSLHPRGVSFCYTFSAADDEIRFCFTIPYLESHLNLFTGLYKGSSHIQVKTFCQSLQGREVESLRVGCLDGSARYRVLLTSRHHACESIASYVLEGLMMAVLQDTESGQWLCRYVEFFVVPFMDKDGVENGDQGKLRSPRDHNRDYDGESIYATTRKLRQFIPQWSEDKLRVAIDLHCPYIKGEHHEVIHFVGGPDEVNWSRVSAFSRILESVNTGELRYSSADNLPFGQAWNVDTPEGKSFSRWVADLPGILLATSIEIPYANVGTQTVTARTARAFGFDLAKALYLYISGASPL